MMFCRSLDLIVRPADSKSGQGALLCSLFWGVYTPLCHGGRGNNQGTNRELFNQPQQERDTPLVSLS
jgi:hypothetical protein